MACSIYDPFRAGTAVYVVCILTGTSAMPDANSDMTFVIDGITAGSFEREKAPGSTMTFDFNHVVFSTTNLSNDAHILQVQTGLKGQQALILLDAIIYTKDDGVDDPGRKSSSFELSPGSADITAQPASSNNSTSQPSLTQSESKSNRKAIIGGSVAAAICVLGVLGILIFCLHSRSGEKITPLNLPPAGLSLPSLDTSKGNCGDILMLNGGYGDAGFFRGTRNLATPAAMTAIVPEGVSVNGSSPEHTQDDSDLTSLPAYSTIELLEVGHSRQTSSTSTNDMSIRKWPSRREQTV